MVEVSEENAGDLKPNSSKVDRVILSKEQAAQLEKWLLKLDEKYNGLVRLTKAGLVNFLIEKHGKEFSDTEEAELFFKSYDEIRFSTRALQMIRNARKNGEKLSLEEIRSRYMGRYKASLLNKKKGRKKKGHSLAVVESEASEPEESL